MSSTRHKEERVSIRLDARQKYLIDQAALALGTTRSGFVLSNAIEAAGKVVNQQQGIRLSQRDWERFKEIVASDADPSPAVLRAAERYRER